MRRSPVPSRDKGPRRASIYNLKRAINAGFRPVFDTKIAMARHAWGRELLAGGTKKAVS